MQAEVLAGLTHDPKYISPKYFYDAAGSRLFEAITELPEYYLTRTELRLLDVCLPELQSRFGDGGCLVEYGSGSSRKIRRLLRVLAPSAYVPVDISRQHLLATASALQRDFPALRIHPACADLSRPFNLPEAVQGQSMLGFFPGSSIGNFEPPEASRFMRQARRALGAQSHLLIGVDRKKDPALLEAAYNDSAGVTARFNLNVLAHLNQRLGANFDLQAFRHRAHYNAAAGCVQMFLVSLKPQSLTLAGRLVALRQGEQLHTENSYKYHHDEFVALANAGGYACVDSWSDADAWFTLFLLRADAS